MVCELYFNKSVLKRLVGVQGLGPEEGLRNAWSLLPPSGQMSTLCLPLRHASWEPHPATSCQPFRGYWGCPLGTTLNTPLKGTSWEHLGHPNCSVKLGFS